KGEQWKTDFEPVGITGTNEGHLEVSSIPPIDLGRRTDYLIRYPHGCIEQTVSSGFPQLFLSDVMKLSKSQKQQTERNVKQTLNKLKSFQLSNGGFSYWPGRSHSSTWGTNYAGHFMLEAELKGYSVPPGMKEKWVSYQRKKARKYNKSKIFSLRRNRKKDLYQAYRLYTLALANSPELGAMNSLRESGKLSPQAKWKLAGAYELAGQSEAANELARNATKSISEYREMGHS
ncbi:MAG: hypothetical protein ABEH43_01115, partial [Flavobacteriales bacterium]